MIFCERPARSLGQDLVDLRLHLLQPVEMLRGCGGGLPAGPLRRLVNHDPRMRQREAAAFARGLQDDGSHRIGHSLHDDRDLDAAATICRIESWMARPSVTLPPALLM